MPTITLKNLPGRLHRRLKARATEHRRSLNSELIACLESVVMPVRLDPEKFLASARKLRKQVAGRLTEEKLSSLKNRGRS